LVSGACQTTMWSSKFLEGSLVLNCLPVRAILNVSNVPADVVIVSLPTTLDTSDDLKLTPLCVFLASNCTRQVLPIARGRRTPCPSFGLNFQTMLSLRSQSDRKRRRSN